MKLLRHGPIGAEKPGALDRDGLARDLSLLVPDFTPEWLSPAKLEALAAIDLSRFPLVPPHVRLGPPIAGSRQFVAVEFRNTVRLRSRSSSPRRSPRSRDPTTISPCRKVRKPPIGRSSSASLSGRRPEG